jgi:hypothetical protein
VAHLSLPALTSHNIDLKLLKDWKYRNIGLSVTKPEVTYLHIATQERNDKLPLIFASLCWVVRGP